MKRRTFIMTLLTFSATKLCQAHKHYHQGIWPALKNASRSKSSSMARRHAPLSIGTHDFVSRSGANINNSQMSAFQHHHSFSTRAAIKSSSPPSTTTTTLYLSPLTPSKSDLITNKSNPKLKISPEKEYILRFDGTSRSSDNNAGSGMVLYKSSSKGTSKANPNPNELWCAQQFLGEATTNEATYMSLIAGLKSARSMGVQRLVAQGRNALILRQMEGLLQVKKPSLKGYYEEAMSLRKEFESFTILQIDKSLSIRATELARKAMDRDMMIDGVSDSTNSTTMQDEGMRKLKLEENTPAQPSKSEEATNAADIQTQSSEILEPINTKNLENFTPAESSNPQEVAPADLGSISPDKTYVLRFDGGSRGNPGTAGAGMVLYDSEDGSELWSGCQFLGDTQTNNQAEYMGLVTGLQCARSLGVENIVAQGDSQLILRQVEGRYKVKSPTLKECYDEAMTLSREFASFKTCHILRHRNGRADELANEAMDTRSSRGFDIS